MSIVRKYQQSPNYSPGRPAGAPNVIVIHYWDDPAKKPSFAGVVSWLCRPRGNSSAHYVVEAGRWTQLVSEDDRAWHAGPKGNPRGIGIECNPRMSKGDLETVAQLIANIRRRLGDLPLRPHNYYMSTSCPGAYQNQLGWLSRRANQINAGKPASTTPAPAPAPVTGKTKTDGQDLLSLDSIRGSRTIARWQQVMGVKPTGVLNRASDPTIRATQKFLNAHVSAGHIKNLTGYDRLAEDGIDGWRTWKVLQFLLFNWWPDAFRKVAGRAWSVARDVDGIDGEHTNYVLQVALNESWAGSGKLGRK